MKIVIIVWLIAVGLLAVQPGLKPFDWKDVSLSKEASAFEKAVFSVGANTLLKAETQWLGFTQVTTVTSRVDGRTIMVMIQMPHGKWLRIK